jgi:hypothetical protein
LLTFLFLFPEMRIRFINKKQYQTSLFIERKDKFK